MRADGGILGLADAGRDGEAAFEQGQKSVVDLIDLVPQGSERKMFGREILGGRPDLLEAGLDTGVGHGKRLSVSIDGNGDFASRRPVPGRSPARPSGRSPGRLSRRIESRRNTGPPPQRRGRRQAQRGLASGPWVQKTHGSCRVKPFWRSAGQNVCDYLPNPGCRCAKSTGHRLRPRPPGPRRPG